MNAPPATVSPGLAPYLYGALRRAAAWVAGLVAGFAVVAGLVATGAVGEVSDAAPGTSVAPSLSARAEQATAQVRRVERLSRRSSCSRRGTGDRIPAHAIVRDAGVGGAAAIRLTSFDEGWAMHLGQAPGELVAVCRH